MFLECCRFVCLWLIGDFCTRSVLVTEQTRSNRKNRKFIGHCILFVILGCGVCFDPHHLKPEILLLVPIHLVPHLDPEIGIFMIGVDALHFTSIQGLDDAAIVGVDFGRPSQLRQGHT